MGLIDKDHSDLLNTELKKKILDTFSLVIINEYDLLNNIKYSSNEISSHEYMATRYLQLQHPDKQGRTSGDGRSIWNGEIKSDGKTWDISSCGTGATSLSPATHIKSKFFKTGDPSVSYGCGYSEVDEGFSSLFFSEILSKNNYKTERILAIIEFDDNIAINIRAHSNLLRPSHMFNHLKQGNYEELRNVTSYYIERQKNNAYWEDLPKEFNDQLDYFLKKKVEVFAQMVANFEDDYIFCWLDWDGDNILMDGGIIDYGSVRQFGLFHSEYRYDDVERYSTSILEQKKKARYIAKMFIQLTDYLKNKVKYPLNKFNNHKMMDYFDKVFEDQKNINILKKIGFATDEILYLVKKKQSLIKDFRKRFSYFERAKSSDGPYELPDGINWNAIYCMRDILRELPQIFLHGKVDKINSEEFINIIKSSYVSKKDMSLTLYKKRKIREFQKGYNLLVDSVFKYKKITRQQVLLQITMRSSIINKYDRVTGDSISLIVDEIMKKEKKISPEKIYSFMLEFSEYQNLDPDNKRMDGKKEQENKKLLKDAFKIIRDYREGV